MDEKSRKVKDYVIERNCAKCIHKDLCKYVEEFDSTIDRIISEAQASDWLIEYDMKCRFHKYSDGKTYKFQSVSPINLIGE